MRSFVLALGLALAATAVRAEVAGRHEAGFTVRNAIVVQVSAARAYAALGEVGKWWDGEHTYSGKAENMTMPLAANACFCESLPNGGGVRHGVVALAIPGQMLRIETALGPLQGEGAAGAMTYEIKAKDGGVEVTQTYKVGGLSPASSKAWEGPVDQVLKTSTQRLKRYLETGKP